ncbi:MAG: isoprenoid biosynthesis glyoxalase ElbB [Desulfobacterales bacterium]|nr:isoprenoid biosynthesis glyoxalase ElbB [Desulfobacterales bacterium]
MKTVGVLLSGCGVYDGVEIHEAVLTLLALDRKGAKIVSMAPDMDQYHIVNHLTGEAAEGKRNVLVESARITRGEIRDLKTVEAAELDALIMPGGFGAAKNLSDFAIKGKDTEVAADVSRILNALSDAGKPIGAICISPAVIARALAHRHPEVTIGNDFGTAEAIETMGAKHMACRVDQIHIDRQNKIVTTPAYMLGPSIKDVAVGIEKLVDAVLTMA